MGVVKRQGIKQSLVTYVGVVIGIANMLFIYPAFLVEGQIGIISYVRETAAMMSLFVFLGGADLVVRYFPHFRDEGNGNNGILFILIGIVTVGCLIFTTAALLFKDRIMAFFAEKEEPLLYLQYAFLIIPATVLVAYGNLFLLYASNFRRIVIPALINELLPKLGLPLLVIAYHFGYISFGAILYGSLTIYLSMLIGQVWYIRYLGQLRLRPKFSFLNKGLLKEMANFSLYGFVGSLGSRFSSEFLNFFMLGTISTLTNTGVYTIAYSIANVVDVPRKAISRIVSPLLADKFKEEKLDEVAELYRKSSINQLIVGLWVFLGIWLSIDQVFEIMPNGERFVAGKYVVLLLGIARIVDMATGVNSEIISYSKYYRYNFYLILLMAVVHVTSSLFFIKTQGLLGVAIASLLTMTVYNLAKYLVLWSKLRFQPFSIHTIKVLFAAFMAVFLTKLMPDITQPFFQAAINSTLFTTLFLGLIYWSKASPDLNLLAEKTVLLARKWLRLR